MFARPSAIRGQVMLSSDEDDDSSSDEEESMSDASGEDVVPPHWRIPPRVPSGASIQSCSAESSEDDDAASTRRPPTHKSVKQNEAILDTLWALNAIECTAGQTGWIELGKAVGDINLAGSSLCAYRLGLLANDHSKPRSRDQARAQVRVLSRREWPRVDLDLPQSLTPAFNDILLRLHTFLLTRANELNLSSLSRKQQRSEDFDWRGWIAWLDGDLAFQTRCQQIVFCNNGSRLLPDALLEMLPSVRCIVHRTSTTLPYWPIMYARLPRLRHIHLTYTVELTRKTSLLVKRPRVEAVGKGAPTLQELCVKRLLTNLPRYESPMFRLRRLVEMHGHTTVYDTLLQRISRCYTCQACDGLVLGPTFVGCRPWMDKLGCIGVAAKKQVKGRVCGWCALA